MAINVTPGSPTAVAYATQAEADAYFTARGIAAWTGSAADKEAALIRGASYLDRRYYGQWVGVRTDDSQSMAWPRSWVVDADGYSYDADEIPTRLKEANYEAALLTLTGTVLEPNLARGGAIKRERAKAGPAESETEYTSGASAYETFSAIEWSLQGLLRGHELLRV